MLAHLSEMATDPSNVSVVLRERVCIKLTVELAT